jgi:hypothetical protein
MTTSTPPDKILRTPRRERLRWVKVAVDDDLFTQLHVMAAESRMRFQAYLRRSLADSRSYRPNLYAPDQKVGERPEREEGRTEKRSIE